MSNNAAINKQYAISKFRSAINNALALLDVKGMEAAYYDWHRNTINKCKASIEQIKGEPETQWN